MKKIRFGLLGTGVIICDYHLPALLKNPHAEVVAIGKETNPERVKQTARELGIPSVYTDYAQMAADPEIDAVVNGLPNHLHASVTIQMLRAGKHVLCEKPMAMNVAEAREMVAAAERSTGKMMLGQVWRTDPEIRWLRDVVQRGLLGDVYKIRGHAITIGWGPPLDSWRVKKAISGGGVFADVGIHSADQIAFIMGDRAKPKKIYARTDNLHHKLEVEDTASVMIEYDGGMTAIIEAGWYHPHANSLHGTIEIYGTRGWARTFPTELHCALEGLNGKFQPVPPRQGHVELPMFEAQMNHFIDCILKDREPVCTARDGLHGMMIIDAVYRSAASGKPVMMDND